MKRRHIIGFIMAGWIFWDETASMFYGPFHSYNICLAELLDYVDYLNNG